MCDECCDVSNKEQLVVCIRWVDSKLQAHEEFIGMYTVSDIKSDTTIVAAIWDTLTGLNISLKKCRRQCYDGASNMTGRKRGVSRQICEEEPKALFLHCYGHALNLAVSDTVKGCEVVKDALDIPFEVSKLISFSPKRAAQFEKLKAELAPTGSGFRVLCPTRWTVRAASLKSMIDNYTVLQEMWEVSKNDSADPSMKARIIGIQTQFNSFKFYFGVEVAYLLLHHSDNLSKTLQSPNISAAEGQKLASMTIATLLQCRSDDAYD